MKENNKYISKKAKIHSSVSIGPFCVIGDNVEIDENCKIYSHVSILGNTKIGKDNTFFPFSSIGSEPQDLKYEGEKSFLVIGDNNTVRENVRVLNKFVEALAQPAVSQDKGFMSSEAYFFRVKFH